MRTDTGRVVDAGIDTAGRLFMTIRPSEGSTFAGVSAGTPWYFSPSETKKLIGKRVRFTFVGDTVEHVDGRVIEKIRCITSIDLIDEDAR